MQVLRRQYAERSREFSDTLAATLAQAVTSGAREAVAASLTPLVQPEPGAEGPAVVPVIVRTWITRRDDRVRPAHREVDGVTLPVGVPFTVGGFPMRYPGDPMAPPSLTKNCRCRCQYRVSGKARFITAPEEPGM